MGERAGLVLVALTHEPMAKLHLVLISRHSSPLIPPVPRRLAMGQRLPDVLDLTEQVVRSSATGAPPSAALPQLITLLRDSLLQLAWELSGPNLSKATAADAQAASLSSAVSAVARAAAPASRARPGGSALEVITCLQRLERMRPGVLGPRAPELGLLALAASGQVGGRSLRRCGVG